MRIIIIGAGVLGASTAFHLARAGNPVTIIDAQLDGRATAAGAGIICPWVSGIEDQAFFRLYTAGGEYYPDLVAALASANETDLGYRRTGAMLVSDDADELAWLDRMAHQRQAPAMGRITRLSSAAAQTAFPPLRPGFGGIHVAGGARVDGRRLAAALLRAAQSYGASFLQSQATPLLQAGRVVGVAVDGDRIPADRVIVTAGAWVNQTLRSTNSVLPIEPQRGQIVHLRLDDTPTQDWPVILPPGSHYIVPFDDGRIVAGATRETGTGFDYRVTAAGQMEVLSEALRIAPGLQAAAVLETRVGFRPASLAARPLLGWMKGIDGLAIGNGLGAAGLTIGPFAGRLLADLVTEQPALIDLAPFAPQRRMEPASVQPALR
jgi:D-amino-acid dehydrogenase